MRIGAVFPTCEIGNDTGAIRAYAQRAEELGYSHLVAYDHVLGAEHAQRSPALEGPYTEQHPFHEPFVLFAWLAAQTRTLELATGVLVLPQRQAALVAKQAAQLALLSGGRLRLGVGSGWNWVEYESLGVPYAERGRRLEEQVALLRELWKGAAVRFHGDFHRVERAGILPAPPGPIPLWFGGYSKPALARAARIGDGFLFGAASSAMQRMCEFFWSEVERAGRARSELGVEAIIHYSAGPEKWRSAAERWKALGATHFSLRTMDAGASAGGEAGAGFASPDQHIAALEEFIEVVRD